MSIKVLIPTPLQKFTNNQATIEAQGATMAELLDSLDSHCPGIKARLCDESGQIRRFLNFYVNSEDIRFLQGLDTPLQAGDEVSIVPAVAGGAEETEAKPKAPAAAKPKPPALEDKPFEEFIQEHFFPTLKKGFSAQDITDVDLKLVQAALPIVGTRETCWQVVGSWQGGDRQFNIYFLDGNLNGRKAFSHSNGGVKPSVLESFMIDERKVNLDLLVLYTLQRLNGQKWLKRN